MFSAIKTFPIQTKPAVSTLFTTNTTTTSNNFAEKATPVIRSTVRFQQASAGKEEPNNMEKKEEAHEVQKKGVRDVMSHSFGEGYATRSDEEGFGGIYGGNQSLSHDDEDKVVYVNHPGTKSMGQASSVHNLCRNRKNSCKIKQSSKLWFEMGIVSGQKLY